MPAEAKTCRLKGGRELTFLFDIDGICAAEDAGGVGIRHLLTGAMAFERQGYLTALVYGGLKANHPEITRAQAHELIQGDDSKAVGAAMGQALDSAFPDRKAAKNPPRAARRNGTGSPSSPPGSKKASTKRASGSRRRAASKSS